MSVAKAKANIPYLYILNISVSHKTKVLAEYKKSREFYVPQGH